MFNRSVLASILLVSCAPAAQPIAEPVIQPRPTPVVQVEPPQNCGPRASVVESLRARYGETRQGLGLARDSGVVEIYASAETGSWTIVLTLPNGASCLIASGEAWEATAPATAGDRDA